VHETKPTENTFGEDTDLPLAFPTLVSYFRLQGRFVSKLQRLRGRPKLGQSSHFYPYISWAKFLCQNV